MKMAIEPGLHPMQEEQLHSKTLVVVGGGIMGCLAALQAARLKDEHGQKKYRVELLEAQDSLLDGASIIASRLHLGGEYPHHPQTALDCLRNAMIWKLTMPDGIYTQSMNFAVARKTHSRKKLTTYMYQAHLERIRAAYMHMLEEVKNSFLKSSRGWESDAEIEAALFGPPKADVKGDIEGNVFYRVLGRGKTKKHALGVSLSGAYQTQELGLDIPLYTQTIIEALKAEGVTIRTGCEVIPNGIADSPQNHTITYIDKNDKDKEKQITADFVVQAAGDRNALITPPPAGKEIYVDLRGMLVVKTTGLKKHLQELKEKALKKKNWRKENIDEDNFKLKSLFVLEGKHGGMFSLNNDKSDTAVVYIPTKEAAYFKDGVILDRNHMGLPKDWVTTPRTPKELAAHKAWMEQYWKAAVKEFPRLQYCKPLSLLARPTVRFQSALELRPHYPTQEVAPGHIVMEGTKLTYAAGGAIEAIEMIEQRRQLGNEAPLIDTPPDAWKLALSSEKYSMRELPLSTSVLAGYNVIGMVPSFTNHHPDYPMIERQTDWRSRARRERGQGPPGFPDQ